MRHSCAKSRSRGGVSWGMLGITSQVKREAVPLACAAAFVRDEEAAGSNPATPTRSQGMQPTAGRRTAGTGNQASESAQSQPSAICQHRPPTPGHPTGAARRRRVSQFTILTVSEAPDYAFPHSAEDESRRLQLLEQRLDPLTKRRIQRLGVGEGARCLEIGGGRGSITRWLSEVVGPAGRVIATDLQLGLLSEIDASNVEVLRHDIRTDTFPPGSFDLIHTRAVLMHISPSVDLLRR